MTKKPASSVYSVSSSSTVAAPAAQSHAHAHAHAHAHVALHNSHSGGLSQLRMASALKTIVSKKKRRYVEDGFNLDLSYIGDDRRIIAMGFPAENVESIFRNSLDDVKRFLDSKHKDHYFIYNLCSERFYDKKKFENRVATYPFDDHHPPDFSIIKPFCEHVHEWLAKDNQNVAVVHCKAGKGRTGVMICCYLLHSRRFKSADDVLRFYGEQRTMDMKGVTIPSQRRYINYYAELLKQELDYKPVKLYLRSIVLCPVPNLGNVGTEFYLSFEVKQGTRKLYQSPDYLLKRSGHGSGASTSSLGERNMHVAPGSRVQFELEHPILVCSDVKIEFSSKTKLGIGLPSKLLQPKKEFHLWFNTFFVDSAFQGAISSSSLSSNVGNAAVDAVQTAASISTAASGPAPPRLRQNHNSSASSSSEESNGGHIVKGPHNTFRVSYPPPERHVSETGGGSPMGHVAFKDVPGNPDLAAATNLMKLASVSDDHLLHNSTKDDSALLAERAAVNAANNQGSHPSVHNTIHSVSSSSSSCSSSSHHLPPSSSSAAFTTTQTQSFIDSQRTRHRSVPQPVTTRTLHPHAAQQNLAPSTPLPEGKSVSLELTKTQIDKVHKDKQCKAVPEEFRITLFLLRPNDQSDAMNYSTSPSCPAKASPCIASKANNSIHVLPTFRTGSSPESSEEDTTDSEAVSSSAAASNNGQALQRASSYQPPITAQTALQMTHQQNNQQQANSNAASNVRTTEGGDARQQVIQSDWI